ncbi:serine/threonine-protein phosphatase [Streptomyces sp. NBC_00841]|uniref:PP2C family protein-serine/threonine phosphatase n=1 Tax=unclassified Streptomyces TaxID=2593676 RepID=UPI00224CEC7E|nr:MULTISPECIES: PP2C family protein-serine/threonine phosphatase [unclassified Streptomyces]MCX4533818.1 serine/threonine-protein phosphatase [Streptomyces sp. NBC_01669]WSA00790.1 serine/threonine-protein phosphatase [Streptomyces sp. NBC_00841]
MADERAWLGELLASVESAPPEVAVAVLAELLTRRLAATEVSFLITDLGGKAVVRLTGTAGEGGPEQPQRIELRGSIYDRVVRSQQAHVASGERAGEAGPGPVEVIAPVSDRGDAIGLLELTLPARPDRQTMQLIVEAAHALAYVVIVNRRFTDLYEWGRRTTRLSLAAEIQHRLLPDSFTCDTGRFIVAGALEPAADIGGDTFDYTLDRHALHLSLTDAMGHDVQAALLATVVVGALRNARRGSGSLLDQANDAHQAVVDYAHQAHQAYANQSDQVHQAVAQHGGQAMATGQLLRVSLDTGQTTFVNAGHVWPLRLRDGRVEEIAPLVDLPFGITPNPGYRVQSLDLRQGDRLILLTDGMLEPHGPEADLCDLIRQTSEWHPRDAVRVFTEAVLEFSNHDPRDDATVLCLDWPAPNAAYTGPRTSPAATAQAAPTQGQSQS